MKIPPNSRKFIMVAVWIIGGVAAFSRGQMTSWIEGPAAEPESRTSVPGAKRGGTVAPVEPAARDERRVLEAGTRAGEERDVEIANGVKMAMCWVPAGTFTMGSPASEADRSGDEAQVEVKMSGFWLAKHECTQRVWSAVMGSNPSYFKGESLPVESVSWKDCQRFIGKLGRLGNGLPFELPTEAQWEYACRAGTSGPYAGVLDEMAWHGGNSGATTHAVGGKKANAWGLMDMHGNVWEWCRDEFQGKLPGGADPIVENAAARVNRGGSWSLDGTYCRSANRSRSTPETRYHYMGFRLAAVPSGKESSGIQDE